MPREESINTKVEVMKTDLRYIKDSQDKMSKKLDMFIEEMHKQRECDLDTFDKRYASKRIEQAFYWVMGVIGTILITAIMYTILK